MSGGLPAGWVEVQLSDVAEMCLGKMLDQKKKAGTLFPYLGNINVRWGKFDTTDLKSMPFEDTQIERYSVIQGDLVVCEGGEPGRCAIWNSAEPVMFQKALHRVRSGPALTTSYLQRCLSLDVQVGKLDDLYTGTTIKHLTGASLAKYAFPLPPLNEQKRIVAKIDALTEKSREARQALDEVPALLDQLRQSILAAAFRGDLTKKWREQNPNVEPASALLDRIRKERRHKWEEAELAKFKSKGKLPPDDKWKAKYVEPEPVDTEGLPELPEGWCWASVEELASVGTGATPKRGLSKYWENGDVPWVTSGAVNDEFVDQPTEFTTVAALAETNISLYPPGTLLVAMYGEGKTRGMCSELRIEASTNQALAAIEVHGGSLSLKGTLKRFMQFNYEATRLAASGGVQPNLNLSHIRRIAIALPPEEEQLALQEALNSCLERVGDLQSMSTALFEISDKLPPTILAKAFRGELVPQDPNDEPANVLLERIRAEREMATPKKKLTKGKKA